LTLTTPQELSELSDLHFKVGLILVGDCTAFVVSSLVIPRKFDYSDSSGNQRLRSFLTVTGLLSITTSVPLFLSSGSNARMAAQLSLQNQTVYQPVILPGQPKDIPALTLRIQL
jgi:hypothetical protein